VASGGTRPANTYTPSAHDPKHLQIALAHLGVRETLPNGKPNPVVQHFFLATDPDGKMFGRKPNTKSVAWCAIYINHVLYEAGISGTGSAMARSFLKWGTEVCSLNGKGTVTAGAWDAIRPGDVAVTWRGATNDGVTGHVFIVTTVGKTWLEGVGGNQGDAVTIQRFTKSKLLGVRRPRSALQKKSVVATSSGALAGGVSEVAEYVIPEPSTLDSIAEGAERLKGPLADLAAIKPWVTGVLSVLSIALIAYGVYKATRNVQQRG